MDGVEGNRIGNILPIDQAGDQSLVGWPSKGLRCPHHKGQYQKMPDLDPASVYQEGQQESTGHLPVLGAQQQLAPVNPICKNSPDQRKEKNGDLAQEFGQAQIKR